MAKIMIQGTGSSVGKSVITAALLRIFHQDGYKVVPYKSQNMSNNSFVTVEGDEMGRAQVLQAYAAKVRPHCIMNPLLIKPSGDTNAQLIVNGKVAGNFSASEYDKMKPKFRKMIKEQIEELESQYDIIVIEGAGSPAEINLRKNDIVNMGLATMMDCPVILVGDIDKGGVFASLYGTVKLLAAEEQDLIKGTIINKFRGDLNLLLPGIKQIEELISKENLGVIPYYYFELEEEDGVAIYKREITNAIDIAVIRLPHLSNHSDFEALKYEEDVSVRFVTNANELGSPDILILPGSKNTIFDLEWIKEIGLFDKINELSNTTIFGLCGGYQMLGKEIFDELHIEGKTTYTKGFNKIPMKTEMEAKKVTVQVRGNLINNTNTKIHGYEIHMGKSTFYEEVDSLFVMDNGKLEGYISEDEKTYGTYIHGVFDSPSYRQFFLNSIRRKKGISEKESVDYETIREENLDKLADIVRENVDIDKIYKIMGVR
ncbi:MAG: cobyric acid synthase CobQ [Alkaliphilus sp.]|nr:cobyric acid synthase [bacterium AH-315-E09]PHS30339.1 MAG: cobyric acid synthase CobQ [Alkaliphilus sp.]